MTASLEAIDVILFLLCPRSVTSSFPSTEEVPFYQIWNIAKKLRGCSLRKFLFGRPLTHPVYLSLDVLFAYLDSWRAEK